MGYPRLIIFIIVYTLSFSTVVSQSKTWIVEGLGYGDIQGRTLSKLPSKTILNQKVISERKALFLIEFADPVEKELLVNAYPYATFTADTYIKNRSNIPNDPQIGNQWALENIGLYQAWDETIGGFDKSGREIVVAIIDDGFDYTLEDIQNNVFKNDGEIPNNQIDDDGNGYIDDYLGLNVTTGNDKHNITLKHGTSVMSIIGADGDNGVGIAGVNWDVKVLLISTSSAVSEIYEAYEYIYQMRKLYNDSNGSKGAFILATNFSAGIGAAPEDFPDWCPFYDDLGSLGILSVGAVPNANIDTDTSDDLPTDCSSDYLIMTTMTNIANVKVSEAGFGKSTVDLGAPGENILVFEPGNELRKTFTGTSAACPHVAGSVGLLYSVVCENIPEKIDNDPSGTALEIKQTMLENVDQVASLQDKCVSNGKLNVYKAMLAMANSICDLEIHNLSFSSDGPNPIEKLDDLSITYKTNRSESHEVILHSIDGKVITRYSDNSSSIFQNNVIQSDFQIENLPKGMYFLSVYNSKDVATFKFLHL